MTVHIFYIGLLYTTKMTVDAATCGALMNKNYTTTYALIEDMAQNHYQWINTASSPSEKEAGMNGISSFDHLFVKVDALTRKFDKMSISAISPASILPPCKICGIFGHASIECQLGGADESIEQVNFVQNNQGIRQSQNFYKTPKNPFGQTTPPSYAISQGVS